MWILIRFLLGFGILGFATNVTTDANRKNSWDMVVNIAWLIVLCTFFICTFL